jgi:hypothetical protein
MRGGWPVCGGRGNEVSSLLVLRVVLWSCWLLDDFGEYENAEC